MDITALGLEIVKKFYSSSYVDKRWTCFFNHLPIEVDSISIVSRQEKRKRKKGEKHIYEDRSDHVRILTSNTLVTFTYFESVSQGCSFFCFSLTLISFELFTVGLWVRYTFYLLAIFLFSFFCYNVLVYVSRKSPPGDVVRTFGAATDHLVQELAITYTNPTDSLQRDIPHACKSRGILAANLSYASKLNYAGS